MNQKTRGYKLLGVCEAFLVINATICVVSGFVCANVALVGPDFLTGILLSATFFGWSLASFSMAGLIRLLIHVADDLYMLRLIAVNTYSRLPPRQLP